MLAEGGNALEAMVAMAATIAVVYPHMNAHRRRRLLAGPRARPASVHAIEACGSAGARATSPALPRPRPRRHSRPRAGRGADRRRAPSAAGEARARAGVASAGGRRLPLRHLLAGRDPAAREGWRAVSPWEAPHRPEPKVEALVAAPGFADTFPLDGKLPDAGDAAPPAGAGRRRWSISPRAGLRRFLPRRHRPRDRRPISTASARRSRARTWSASRRGWWSR